MSVVGSKKLNAELKKCLTPNGPERGGLILRNLKLHEFENTSENPNEGFEVLLTIETLELLKDAVGTWHTHPGASANLSVEDHETFVSWPDWEHAIIGEDDIRWYRVDRGMVINA